MSRIVFLSLLALDLIFTLYFISGTTLCISQLIDPLMSAKVGFFLAAKSS